jgi:hypothetical protein
MRRFRAVKASVRFAGLLQYAHVRSVLEKPRPLSRKCAFRRVFFMLRTRYDSDLRRNKKSYPGRTSETEFSAMDRLLVIESYMVLNWTFYTARRNIVVNLYRKRKC